MFTLRMLLTYAVVCLLCVFCDTVDHFGFA